MISLQTPVTAKRIQQYLIGCLRFKNNTAVLANVFIQGSPWECDVISITNRYYFSEYEIKLSVADYQKDFSKRIRSWSKDSLSKHDLYSSDSPIDGTCSFKGTIPKPRRFYFVTPKGLLDGISIPSHCGLVEFDENARCWKCEVKREAPPLKSPTKLSQEMLFNLTIKAAAKVNFNTQSTGY